MADSTTALAAVIKEEIAPGIREWRTRIDPVWENVISNSIGVSSDGLGRDWKYIQSFVVGLSGAYEFVGTSVMRGADLAYAGTNISQFGTPNTFPGRAETTAPAFYQKTVYLKEARGTFSIPLKWMQQDAWPSTVGPLVSKIVAGNARKAALQHILSFYGPTNAPSSHGSSFSPTSPAETADLYKLVLLKDVSEVTDLNDAKTHTITFTGDTAEIVGRINMIFVGQTFDIYHAKGGVGNDEVTRLNTKAWVVTVVDYMGTPGTNRGTFTIASIDDTETVQFATADEAYWLVPRNSAGKQPSGLNSFIKASGDIYGVSLTTRPWFKSMVITDAGGPLTEIDLNKWYGTFFERYQGMCDLDTAITSPGVIHAFLENQDNNTRIERNGRRLSLMAGWDGVDYGYDGKKFDFKMSTFVEPETLFMVKLGGGNLTEKVPPKVAGTGRNSQFDSEIQFVAQLGGSKSIFLHERVEDGVSAPVGDQMEAPYYRQCELAVDQVQSIKVSGLTESYA